MQLSVFPLPLGHLCVFLGEMSVEAVCPLLPGLFVPLVLSCVSWCRLWRLAPGGAAATPALPDSWPGACLFCTCCAATLVLGLVDFALHRFWGAWQRMSAWSRVSRWEKGVRQPRGMWWEEQVGNLRAGDVGWKGTKSLWGAVIESHRLGGL